MAYYYNKSKVKRYKRKRKSKAKNPKNKYTIYETVTTDLGNESEFKHNQEVIIIDAKDFEEIEEKLQNMDISKTSPGNDQQNTTEPEDQITNQQLQKQLLDMDNNNIKLDQLNQELNYYKSQSLDLNRSLIGLTNTFNLLIDEVITKTRHQYEEIINQQYDLNKRELKSIIKTLNDTHRSNLEAYRNHNKRIRDNIDQEVEDANQQINNANIIKLYFKRKDVNLQVPTNDLNEDPEDLKLIDMVNNDQAIEKALSKPNLSQVDNTLIKQNLDNIPNFEDLAIESSETKKSIDM